MNAPSLRSYVCVVVLNALQRSIIGFSLGHFAPDEHPQRHEWLQWNQVELDEPGDDERHLSENVTKHRSYRLHCPIARALDRIGDRWALVILRDLHAGPARFGELQAGLPGLASNLLTTRLQQLMADGLIVHERAEHGAMVYALTPAGEQTAPVLFELAMFGSQFPAPPDRRRPGNLRTVAITLKEALRRVVTNEEMRIEFIVDDEPFAIDIGEGQVRVSYRAASDAPLAVATDYEAMMERADGNMSMQDFSRKHVELRRGTKEAAMQFAGLLAKAFSR